MGFIHSAGGHHAAQRMININIQCRRPLWGQRYFFFLIGGAFIAT